MDAQSHFDYLLWYFKEGHAGPRNALYEMTNFQQSLSPNIPEANRQRAITIMESSIFHKGGLKGRRLAKAGPPDFVTYPIEGLYDFIIGIVIGLQVTDQGEDEIRELIDKEFQNILSPFNAVVPLVIFLGGAQKRSVYNVRNTLKEWKEKTFTKLVKRVKEMAEKGKNVKLFASGLMKHFTSHVPDAPRNLRATRISELLRLFSKEISRETLRRKKEIRKTTDPS